MESITSSNWYENVPRSSAPLELIFKYSEDPSEVAKKGFILNAILLQDLRKKL